jgi:hypothetical protein
MPQSKKRPEQPAHPKGALALTLIYMVTIIILWSWVYLTLIERGVTR